LAVSEPKAEEEAQTMSAGQPILAGTVGQAAERPIILVARQTLVQFRRVFLIPLNLPVRAAKLVVAADAEAAVEERAARKI
jgi:hypothetical protein